MKGKLLCSTLILMGAVQAHATTLLPLAFCTGCSAAQEESTALSMGLGNVYVADVQARTVNAYSVYADVDDSTRPPTHVRYADLTPGSEPYLSAARGAVNFYNMAPKGWTKSLNLSTSGVLSGSGVNDIVVPYSDGTKNVYNVIDPGVPQNSLTNWVKNSAGSYANGYMMNFIGLAGTFHVVDMTAVQKIVITVTFQDGSKIDIDADFSTTNPTYTVDPKSGRDSHGNNVPATRQAATCSTGGQNGICTYNFDGPGNPTDLPNWTQRMQRFGVTIGTGGTGGSPHGTWACVSTGEGENTVYYCQFIP